MGEADDSWWESVREAHLQVLNELLEDPEELNRLAEEQGLQLEDLNLDLEELSYDALAEQLFCP